MNIVSKNIFISSLSHIYLMTYFKYIQIYKQNNNKDQKQIYTEKFQKNKCFSKSNRTFPNLIFKYNIDQMDSELQEHLHSGTSNEPIPPFSKDNINQLAYYHAKYNKRIKFVIIFLRLRTVIHILSRSSPFLSLLLFGIECLPISIYKGYPN